MIPLYHKENSKIEKEDESKQQIPKVGSPEEIKTGSMEEDEAKELVTNIGSPVNICIKLHQTICQSSVRTHSENQTKLS